MPNVPTMSVGNFGQAWSVFWAPLSCGLLWEIFIVFGRVGSALVA